MPRALQPHPTLLVLVAALACASAPSPAPEPPQAPAPKVKDDPRAVERVRARYAEVNAVIDGGRAERSYLAADAEHHDDGPWQRVKTEEACWVEPEDVGEHYERFPTGCATVWRLEGKVVRARVATTSPSGDWGHSVEYTFWPDGRVAFRLAEHRGFACAVPDQDEDDPGFEVCGQDEREYRDERGRVVRVLAERWGQPRGGKRRVMPEVSFPYDDSAPHPARLAELPFAKQLR